MMHLYYNAHEKSDLTKLGELLAIESSLRSSADEKSDTPEPEGFRRQINFIFRTINAVNAVIGFIFFLSGVIVFFEYRKSDADFGASAFTVVSFVLGLCGITFCIYSVLSLLICVRSFQHILLYAIGGASVFIAMVLACAVKVPSTAVILRNVSAEMVESIYLSKKGNLIERDKWKNVQTSLHCCGVTNYLDWCEPKNTSHEQRGLGRTCAVPRSCFSNTSDLSPSVAQMNQNSRRPFFVRGCYNLQMEILHMNMNLYRSFGYLMIIFVGFATLFAIFLMTVIHR